MIGGAHQVDDGRPIVRKHRYSERRLHPQVRLKPGRRLPIRSLMGGRSVPLLALAAFAAVVPAALLHFVGRDKVLIDGWIHFGGVALGAGIATVAAVTLTVAGARQR